MDALRFEAPFRERSNVAGALCAVLLLASAGTAPAEVKLDSFNEYIRRHDRRYETDVQEMNMRKEIFRRRQAAIEEHNSRQDETWHAAVNQFTDRTDEELSMRLGWRHLGGLTRREATRVSDRGSESTIEVAVREASPEAIDWRNLTMASPVHDQGHCGSCWAVATAVVLEAHYEIRNRKTRRFSVQELVSCVQNPRHCGGKGGCDGATVELALDWAIRAGLATDADTPYEAKDLSCKKDTASFLTGDTGPLDADGRVMTSPEWLKNAYKAPESEEGDTLGGHAFGLAGFTTLAVNREAPLIQAVVEKGPVAIAVAANTWFSYAGGVFDNCPKDWVVNHAVTLFGYGAADTKKGNRRYWLIRNSWGPAWGEEGYIRMIRQPDEEAHCGTDHKPEEGVACDGGPPQVTVCGSCGVLYDSVVPHFKVATASSRASSRDSQGAAGESSSGDGGAADEGSSEATPPAPAPVDFPLRRPEEQWRSRHHQVPGSRSVAVEADASLAALRPGESKDKQHRRQLVRKHH
eukprot:TRINITY_DN34070_c0_g1_i1.p1 TRINITY_DN34070_c0_g1~~TRINITY_DN34070_c0_g1_i1.p1  ORF type:complete len:540 (-),score=104.20 TRINITY_DN34070_c0_g1_i1:281-1843(-)